MLVQFVKALLVSVVFWSLIYFYGNECKNIYVNVKIKSNKADAVQLFWSQNPIVYSEINSFKNQVLKSHKWQIIRFPMPVFRDSVFLRFDFGELNTRGRFFLESIIIDKGVSSIFINKNDIGTKFFFNENCKFDGNTGLLETFATPTSNDPFCVSTKRFDFYNILRRQPSFFSYIYATLIFISVFLFNIYANKIKTCFVT